MAACSTSCPAAQGLVADPTTVDHQSAVVVDDQEKPGALAPRCLGVGDEGTDQDVSHPALVRLLGLEAAEGPPVAEQLGPRQATLLEVLAQGALGHAHPVTDGEDLGDVRG